MMELSLPLRGIGTGIDHQPQAVCSTNMLLPVAGLQVAHSGHCSRQSQASTASACSGNLCQWDEVGREES